MASRIACLMCSRVHVVTVIAETVRKALSSLVKPSLLGLLSSQARRNSPLKFSLKVVGPKVAYAHQLYVPFVN